MPLNSSAIGDLLNLISHKPNQPTPSFTPAISMLATPRPTPPSDPFQSAVTTAKQQYPRIANIPFMLTKGTGPGWSETYEPEDDLNPHRGSWTVQLRSQEALANPHKWADTVALESIHALQANDKRYQQFTDRFVKSMTPEQTSDAKRAYERDKKVFGVTEPFDKWLSRVQAQEYIRGGVFPHAVPGWIGPKGEGRYTPEQMKLMDEITQYLKTSD